MSSFLSSLTDKAQAALNATPLGAHIPHRTTSPGAEQKPGAATSTPFGQFESIQHQIKTLGQQYATTSPIQKIITTEKGVAIDFDSLSRDSKTQSKELYTWGQTEADDLKDVSDRLAYFNFVQGSLAGTLAVKLDAARAPIKALRDAETAITPRRNIRAGLALSISRLEHEQAKGTEGRLVDLRNQLKKHEEQDESKEKEIEILKRKAVRESEQLKWDAIREYAEKLVLISQAASPVIAVLPLTPPSAEEPYKGAQSTAATRASLQRALDNYKTGRINLSPESSIDSDFDTRSFGESHASELALKDSASGITLTPPQHLSDLPGSATAPPSSYKSTDGAPSRNTTQSPPVNPAQLNNTPASIPIPASGGSTASPAPLGSPDKLSSSLPPIVPTVAETGVPVSAGANGPGPASGSLLDIKGAAPDAGPRSGGLPGKQPSESNYGQTGAIGTAAAAAESIASVTSGSPSQQYESAEDEKKRLQREERERILSAQGPPPPADTSSGFESAEDEKKRLQREERERILNAGGSGPSGGAQGPPPGPKDGDDLPAYQAF
ncbi:hypothetical protein HWV62_36272 [Athelia sp. TMB]|nr:hypothetical protein HWV62_36272 [Athelia sp. TMB]